ncbi:DUF1769-domain-containing protein [Dissoconium aciculare CBS 342.82]|uniref:DUF1769-domain-containing protein n=1 Tax=Dissoconium aciculare CBS 342.82 TaxID=1314786 RepID=A0A6J3M1Z1_9PEZI|nr:DUF1769-domain-containing protein [Dissoconium aciculare CBS 342.82]KAF1822026.1 DUF1769-domain-containing protein [Dissoconium aciculare CBS 342.82]
MASSITHRLSGGLIGSSGETASEEEAAKYRLLVTAGPAYDQKTHQIVRVNTNRVTTIENEFLTAKISVRVKDYRGLPASSPSSSPYFEDPIHKHDLYSVAFSFVPKRDLPSVDTVWGNDFDHPIRDRIPPGFNTAFRIVKEFIDPGLSCDAYADEPWLYGPSLSCWFGLRIGDVYEPGQDFPAPDENNVLTEGADGSGQEKREALGLPANNEKRRKHFLSQTHREAFVFEKGRCYQGDFYNPYIDFGNFLLKLPGFSLKVIKYVEGKTHCLRYVFKNRATNEVYFNVNFFLVWGEQLERALAEDKEQEGVQGGDLASVLLPPGQTTNRSLQNSGVAVKPQAQRTTSHPSPGLDDVE